MNLYVVRREIIPMNHTVKHLVKKGKANGKHASDETAATSDVPNSVKYVESSVDPNNSTTARTTRQHNTKESSHEVPQKGSYTPSMRTMVHILSKNMLKKLARASAVENDSVSDGLTCKEQLHQQKSFITNMKTFHKALKYKIYQCYVPSEAWPLKSKPKSIFVVMHVYTKPIGGQRE